MLPVVFAYVVVVFGSPGPAGVAEVCQQVLRDGGSVLIASSRFDDLRAAFPTRPAVLLRSTSPRRFEDRRLVGAVAPVGLIGPDLRPGGGLGLDVPADVAVELPPSSLVLVGPGDPWVGTVAAVSRDGLPVAAGGVGPKGKPGWALVVASDAVFSNALLAGLFPDGSDTGNLAFAVNTVRWLKPTGDGPVPCLFLDHGRVAERFDEVDYADALQVPVPPVTPPLSAFLTPEAQAKLTEIADQAIDRIQENDRLNVPFAGPRYGKTMRWVVGVFALAAAVALVRRARAARRPAVPTLVATPAAVGVLAQRQQEQLGGSDHSAAVREYLVELFRTHGLPLDQYRHPTRMPRVEADRDTQERVRTLWQAAYGPHAVTYTRWKELEPMIEAVRAAGAAGRWRFAGGTS